MGSKTAKAHKGKATTVIFHQFSNGVKTNRDVWLTNFSRDLLAENVQQTIAAYNQQVFNYERRPTTQAINVDDFVVYDDSKIKWSSTLKRHLMSGHVAEFSESNLRQIVYRPFTKKEIFFDKILTDRPSLFPAIFPTTESENRVICVPGAAGRTDFWCYLTNVIPNTSLITLDANQCFPFYIYDEDGTNRQENITDWALAAFQNHYNDDTISKWDIFHYNYALLHHPDYREKYQANLKRDLPHIPFAKDFWGFANAGKALVDLHVNYESVPKYEKLQLKETPDTQRIDWQVEKMRFSKDRTQIYYNDYFTLTGIPAEAFDYRLGNRSALEWVVDQYRVKVDKRSGIVNDPNRVDQPQSIVDLIGRVITVSLETREIVKNLPAL